MTVLKNKILNLTNKKNKKHPKNKINSPFPTSITTSKNKSPLEHLPMIFKYNSHKSNLPKK